MKFLLFLSFLFFCGCKELPHFDKTLRLHFLSEANSLDPRYGYEIPANHLVKMLYEGLIRVTSDGMLTFGVAESYRVSEDGKCYTFILRESKWSNGTSVTAYDFEYAWTSIVDPKLPTLGTADLYPIKNVEAIVRGELPLSARGCIRKN